MFVILKQLMSYFCKDPPTLKVNVCNSAIVSQLFDLKFPVIVYREKMAESVYKNLCLTIQYNGVCEKQTNKKKIHFEFN